MTDDQQTLVTIFSAPKPFRGHIDLIQRNAIDSWLALGDQVEVILVGDEEGIGEVAAETGIRHIQDVERNEQGTPLISSIFKLAGGAASSPLLCYINADVILLDDFLPTIRWTYDAVSSFLIVGQRWDVNIRERLTFREEGAAALRSRLTLDGRLHPPAGSDYFVFPRDLLTDIPPFALGRAGWDNWMIYAGRAAQVPVIDATERITIVHQDHGYNHLPDGQPHYRLPESQENVAMGGGIETKFNLRQCSHRLEDNGLVLNRPRNLSEFQRWAEAASVLRFGPGKAAKAVRLLVHPIETARYFLRPGKASGNNQDE
ncbi:MAG: hypothetical protein KAR65_06975 [Anaerolineales bacterium]|nr:hypothetical protein [Anaerolineales bacterium]